MNERKKREEKERRDGDVTDVVGANRIKKQVKECFMSEGVSFGRLLERFSSSGKSGDLQ
jgi:hypothetical protein